MDLLKDRIGPKFMDKINRVIDAIDGNGVDLVELTDMVNVRLEEARSLLEIYPKNEVLMRNEEYLMLALVALTMAEAC